MDKILIIIVIYNKDIHKVIMKDTSYKLNILVYDNSKKSQNYPENIYYIHDSSNSGVSRAYNKGIELAKKMNKKYCLKFKREISKFKEKQK